MIPTDIVNGLGGLAGGVWMAGAFYLQMVRSARVHPGAPTFMFLIGAALFLGSASIVVDAPRTVALLVGLANTIFLLVGLAVAYALDRKAEREEVMAEATTEDAAATDHA